MQIDMKAFAQICAMINWDKATPTRKNVLKSLEKTPEIKVVILGQDPYPTPGVANGYAFAVNKDVPIPASLAQILREIQAEFGTIHTDRTLESWTKQGILLLNTALTTEVRKPGAHAHLWKRFTTAIIKELGQNESLVWILWGNSAKQYRPYIRSQKVIVDAHPSPLSRKYRRGNTFREIRRYIELKW